MSLRPTSAEVRTGLRLLLGLFVVAVGIHVLATATPNLKVEVGVGLILAGIAGLL